MDKDLNIKSECLIRDYVFLLTSYMLGALDGRNVGKPGYSHEFVARLFRPLLEKWGSVCEIKESKNELQSAVKKCIAENKTPIHFSVLPYQDVLLPEGVVNIVVPAWEFPDVPDHPFDGNPQNDWVRTCDKTDLCIVSGPFTQKALEKSCVKTPIFVVPTPVPDSYFQLPTWSPEQAVEIDTWAFDFPPRIKVESRIGSNGHVEVASNSHAPNHQPKIRQRLELLGRKLHKMPIYSAASNFIWDKIIYRKSRDRNCPTGLPFPKTDKIVLNGIVYTSIFNPYDGRKNWKDLLNGFLYSVGQREHVTLVIKLASTDIREIRKIINYYVDRDVPHKCRVVFISAFLNERQLLDLCKASTFYIHTTKAEGSCLPLMTYLAAGRPAVSPRHSCLEDYFNPEHGFVIDSEQEPAAWPQEKRHRFRTTWARISWNSLCSAIKKSYTIACEPDKYDTISRRCRSDMKKWASYESVETKLRSALKQVIEI